MTICNDESCSKVASFNFNDLMPRYCATHKLEKMINVKNKQCENLNCTTKIV